MCFSGVFLVCFIWCSSACLMCVSCSFSCVAYVFLKLFFCCSHVFLYVSRVFSCLFIFVDVVSNVFCVFSFLSMCVLLLIVRFHVSLKSMLTIYHYAYYCAYYCCYAFIIAIIINLMLLYDMHVFICFSNDCLYDFHLFYRISICLSCSSSVFQCFCSLRCLFLLCLYVEAHVVFVCYVFMCFSFVCVSYVFLLRLFVMFVYVCAHALRSYFNDVFSCFWFFLFVFVSSVVL